MRGGVAIRDGPARGAPADEPGGHDPSRCGGARARRDARQPADRGRTGLGRAARHGLQRLGRLQVARGARLGARARAVGRARAPRARDDASSSPPRRSRTATSTAGARSSTPRGAGPTWSMGHELYCAGHLFQAGGRAGTSDRRHHLLTVACRFADLIDEMFGAGHATRRRTAIPRSRSRSSSCTAARASAATWSWPTRSSRGAATGSSAERPLRPRLLPGRRAGSRRTLDRRARRARAVSRRRRHRHLRRDRRRGAARRRCSASGTT